MSPYKIKRFIDTSTLSTLSSSTIISQTPSTTSSLTSTTPQSTLQLTDPIDITKEVLKPQSSINVSNSATTISDVILKRTPTTFSVFKEMVETEVDNTFIGKSDGNINSNVSNPSGNVNSNVNINISEGEINRNLNNDKTKIYLSEEQSLSKDQVDNPKTFSFNPFKRKSSSIKSINNN
ncbi:8705_t:CDS:2 [Entrophospora sp. SA101]|nr:8705_t:CDS:2 [Entrophospora sp. SA101]